MKLEYKLKKKEEPGQKPAVAVRGLTKEFIIPHDRRTTLFENLKGVFTPSTYERFVALKEVTFNVEKGESIGIIGDNGSGKSTILKVISNIIRPTRGSIEVNGRITPFLELGVGFQNDLTARENIEVYSTIMGLKDREIHKNIDSVLEFAGLMRFKDTKLKNFSSGMQVRLAFSTAIQVKPDILLIDEVLAVGDMEFQQKCLDTFHRYKEEGVTMLFVSHDMNAIRRFCDKALLLNKGSVAAYGDVNEVIDRYVYGAKQERPAPQNVQQKAENKQRWGDLTVEITGVKFLDKNGGESGAFKSGDPMTARISFDSKRPVDNVAFGIMVYNEGGTLCYGTNTMVKMNELILPQGKGEIDLYVERLPMLEGKYFLTVAAHSKEHIPYDWHDRMYSFTVHNPTQDIGLFEMPCKWTYRAQ